MDIVMAVLIGIGLSASAGFRVFTPMLVASIAAKMELVVLASKFEWVGSTPALIAFIVATLLEVCSYYIPVIDNLMKTIATPVAAVAGIILTASFIGDMDPMFTWSVSVIGGGGIATITQLTALTVRGASTLTTGGFANVFVSAGEGFLAIVTAILAILFPVIVIIFIGIILFLAIKIFRKIRNRRKLQAEQLTM